MPRASNWTVRRREKVVLPEGKTVREVINQGKREFKDIIPLLDKSKKFKHWLQRTDEGEQILREYYRSISEKSWIEKLPNKLVRFSLFTGAGLLADIIITGGLGTLAGVALSVGDNFIVDRLAKGWTPDQYIDEISTFVK